jgi:hypothetical protein
METAQILKAGCMRRCWDECCPGKEPIDALDSVCPRCDCRRTWCMGAKYLPTIKDQKLGRRFQQKQHVQSKFIKPAAPAPLPKARKK